MNGVLNCNDRSLTPVVYATAREFDAELLICGAHFENLPGVVLVKKIGNSDIEGMI